MRQKRCRTHTEPLRIGVESRTADLSSYHLPFCPGQRPGATPHTAVRDAHRRVRHPPFLTEKGPGSHRGPTSHPTGMLFAGQPDATRAALIDGGRLAHAAGRGD